MASSWCRISPIIPIFVGFLLVFSLVCPVHSLETIEDRASNQTFRPNEELKKLKIIAARLSKINKPAVKTIQSPDGDIIDCVVSHLQPAFDHPQLKGQKPLHAVGYVSGDQYYGAKASINVWAPRVANQYEFSLSQIKCGSSQVHLAMTLTPLKLVGRLAQSCMGTTILGSLLIGLLMLVKQPSVTIFYAPALFRLTIELQLGLQSLPLPHAMVDNSMLAYWFGSDMAIRVLFLLLAFITMTTATTTNFTSSHTSTATTAKIGLVET